jgi:hypothetical protein
MPYLSFTELDKITGHKDGMYTWMTKGLLWLASNGFNIVHIENIDYKLFAERGREYLKEIWSKEVFDIQDRLSDFDSEQKYARELFVNDKITLMNDSWTLDSILEFKQDYFVMLSVNPFVLDGKEGCGSHLICVIKFDDKMVKICDPDKGIILVDRKTLERAISKDDSQVTFIKRVI